MCCKPPLSLAVDLKGHMLDEQDSSKVLLGQHWLCQEEELLLQGFSTDRTGNERWLPTDLVIDEK